MISWFFDGMKGFETGMKDWPSLRKLIWQVAVISLLLSISLSAYDFSPEIQDALTAKDTTQVLKLIEKGIKNDPGFAPFYLLRGQIYYERKEYEKGIKEFDQALKKKSKLYEALYFKGLALLYLDKLEDAEKAFDKGIKKAKEEKALFHNGLGLLYMKKEDYGQADVQFSQAIQAGPDQAEFHVNLGDANFYRKVYGLAIAEYNRVIEIDTTYLDVYFRLARAYMVQKQFNQALEQLRVVLARDDSYAYAWKEMGKIYTMAGLSAPNKEAREQLFKDAIGSYREFVDLAQDSSDGEVFFNLGKAYYNLSGFASADSAFEYVLSIGDVPSNIYLYLGRGSMGEKKYDKGIQYLQKHLEWLKEQDSDRVPGSSDADIFRRIANGYKETGDNVSASENFSKAFELDSTNGRYAVEAAMVYHKLKDFPQALHYYQKRIEIGPEQKEIYLYAAYCLLNMEDYEATLPYLLKVVELDSLHLKAYSHLSDVYLTRLEDCENGVKWTKKLFAMDTTNCEALKLLGFSCFVSPCKIDYLKAIDYYRKALDCFKAKGMDNCGNSDVILYIAQAYHLYAAGLQEQNKKEESKKYFKLAFDWYKKCLKCDPGNADCKQGITDTEFEF